MTKKDEKNTKNEKSFGIESLENRDAPKIAGGGLDDGSLSRGGGKPSKPE